MGTSHTKGNNKEIRYQKSCMFHCMICNSDNTNSADIDREVQINGKVCADTCLCMCTY